DAIDINLNNIEINVYPNPASDYLVMQFNGLAKDNIAVEMYDFAGKLVQKTVIYQGSTIAHIDTRSLYNGQYIIRFSSEKENMEKKIIINRD
ncbi:MAG: T9SS type A sorting domain-containing protein, partial [Flavobacteriales bacterium]|nr:T9SS type A sorting domain-containing protein [Flavobacteriales bacterium]